MNGDPTPPLSSKTMLGVNPRELHSWRSAECGGACERVYKADDVDAEIERLREALERIDAHLEVRPDSELGQLQVISHNHSFGFWLALKAAREVLRNERKPFETLAPPAQRHSRDCDCHDCHYSKKHPQVKPHHARCGCFECAPRGPVETSGYQLRVVNWALECFGEPDTSNRDMRTYRFLEEALELAQACGCSRESALKVLAYVYGRPPGVIAQETGGTMVSLAVLCEAWGLDLDRCAEEELTRVLGKIEHIRTRHAAKPDFSPPPNGDCNQT